MHVCMYIYVYIYTYIYVCMHVCMYIYVYIYTYTYIYAALHIYIYISIGNAVMTRLRLRERDAASEFRNQMEIKSRTYQLSTIAVITHLRYDGVD